MTKYRVADSVVVEPLLSSWPAWWCSISPLSGAMHAAGYQIPALRSYLRNPQSHVAAARNPKLAGGTFVDVAPERAAAIQALLGHMETTYKDALEATDAVHAFNERLLGEAQGQTLETLYRDLPACLRGLVELVYDYHSRPAIRFDEGLLYTTSLYKRDEQSVRLWTLDRDKDRPFYMSTPRPPDEREIDLRVPFDDARVKRIVETDVEPQPLETIREIVGDGATAEATVERYFSVGEPRVAPSWVEDTIRVRYIGHACVLVECHGVSVLVDPFVSPVPAEGGQARYSFADLPRHIDFALVTHAHSDHFAPETLLRIRPRVRTLVVPRSRGLALGDVSLKRIARALGYEDVREVDTLDNLAFDGGEIVATPFLGEHGDLDHGKATYVVRFGGHRLLFAADSTSLDIEMQRRVRRLLGPIQTVFMNTETEGAPLSWPFASLFPKNRNRKLEQSRRCRGSNAKEGLAMLEALEANRLFNYAMGLEPWLERIIGPASGPETTRMREAEYLLKEARGRGIDAKRLEGSEELFLEPA